MARILRSGNNTRLEYFVAGQAVDVNIRIYQYQIDIDGNYVNPKPLEKKLPDTSSTVAVEWQARTADAKAREGIAYVRSRR